jgi:hypothetical protein
MQLSYGEQFQIARRACAAAKQACLGDLKPKPKPKKCNEFFYHSANVYKLHDRNIARIDCSYGGAGLATNGYNLQLNTDCST